MQTVISLPDRLFAAADCLARRLRISRSRLFQRAVREYIAAHRDDGVTQALDEIYGPAAEQAGVDRGLDHLQSASLPREDW